MRAMSLEAAAPGFQQEAIAKARKTIDQAKQVIIRDRTAMRGRAEGIPALLNQLPRRHIQPEKHPHRLCVCFYQLDPLHLPVRDSDSLSVCRLFIPLVARDSSRAECSSQSSSKTP